jgi:hypothetical protein
MELTSMHSPVNYRPNGERTKAEKKRKKSRKHRQEGVMNDKELRKKILEFLRNNPRAATADLLNKSQIKADDDHIEDGLLDLLDAGSVQFSDDRKLVLAENEK